MSAIEIRAKQLYESGLSLREIGRKIGRSHERVRLILLAEGVRLRERGGAHPKRVERAAAPAPAAHERAAAPAYKTMALRSGERRSSVRRFASPPIEPERVIDLAADHPAIIEGRTIFPRSVVGAADSPRLLVSGHNNSKLGKEVLRGSRAGWPIFHLTLEERATCPRSCPVFTGCYGNSSPFARRHRADDELIRHLRGEVAATEKLHPGGFLVRLHTLGDFFSVEYVLMWAELLAAHPALHVFGYTARRVDDPDAESSKIARAVALLTGAMWARFAIRTSHADFGPQRSVVVLQDPALPDVVMCPAQVKATEACASCGLCWAEAARDKAIGFLKHGMKKRQGRQRAAPEIDDGSGPKKDDRGNCQPREKGPASPPAGDSIRQVYSPSARPTPPLALRSLEGARLACGAEPADDPAAYPARVRVLAACALFRGGWMTGGAAAEACSAGDRSRLSPSQIGHAGVSEAMIDALVEYLRLGAEPQPQADPRPGHIGERTAEVNETRLPEAIRLYRDEGLSLEQTGKRLDPPLSCSRVHDMLTAAGIETRPRGTVGPRPGLRSDGQPRVAPRKTERRRTYSTATTRDRMREPTNDIVRWSRAYMARGVEVEYLADLFDCEAEALAAAVGVAA
jgi:hypothetical protein